MFGLLWFKVCTPYPPLNHHTVEAGITEAGAEVKEAGAEGIEEAE